MSEVCAFFADEFLLDGPRYYILGWLLTIAIAVLNDSFAPSVCSVLVSTALSHRVTERSISKLCGTACD